VERKIKSAIVAGIYDKEATIQCYNAGEGKKLQLSIGATVEKRFGPPLEAEVEILHLVKNDPRMAVIRISDVEVILAEKPVAFTNTK
jgi:microcystin degradation protein MlrC